MKLSDADYESIRTFQTFCNDHARERGFYEDVDELHTLMAELKAQGHDRLANFLYASHLGNRLMLIVGEVSEAHEEERSGHSPSETYYSETTKSMATEDYPYFKVEHRFKPEGVPSELADIFIRLLDHAGELGVDLASAVKEKLEYNATREYLHGKLY
jgi:NTP pyrophosphatase (non-canonical NTP hydrolase)